jgi:hypothetical protein
MGEYDGRLRLERHVAWVPAEETGEQRGYSQGLMWIVEGIGGSVALNVDMGGFRNGDDEDQARELHTDRYVQAGLAARGVFAHARRPFPHLTEDSQNTTDDCVCLTGGGRCWSHVIVWDSQPELAELLTRLVQPGGPEFVWERLEELYRAVFDSRPSPLAERKQTARIAAELAQARAEGAARATGAAADEAQSLGQEFADEHTVSDSAAPVRATDMPGTADIRGVPERPMTHPDDAKQVHDLVDVLYHQGKSAQDMYDAIGGYIGARDQ